MNPEPERDTRRDDSQALEEIRRLFTRYRQRARHGQMTDPEESAEAPAPQPADGEASVRPSGETT
jgi:hypothetical protein